MLGNMSKQRNLMVKKKLKFKLWYPKGGNNVKVDVAQNMCFFEKIKISSIFFCLLSKNVNFSFIIDKIYPSCNYLTFLTPFKNV